MLGNAPVQHIAGTRTTDQYGDTTETKANPVDVSGAAFAPRASTERTDPRAPAVLSGGSLYLTVDSISPLDQFLVNGELYEVEGEPGRWVSPFDGRDFGYEVAIRRYEQP